MWKRRNKKEFEMLAVKCLLVLDSFYVTMKDIVVSFDAIVYSKQKIGTKKCLQTFYASTRGPSVSNPVHLLGMNNKIKNSFVIESVRDQTDAAASDCISFGDILGLASVLNLLRSFLLLKVRSFLLSLYEELLSTMFERLLGSSGIVAGEVVPKHNHVIF